jgi:hypothetical protein
LLWLWLVACQGYSIPLHNLQEAVSAVQSQVSVCTFIVSIRFQQWLTKRVRVNKFQVDHDDGSQDNKLDCLRSCNLSCRYLRRDGHNYLRPNHQGQRERRRPGQLGYQQRSHPLRLSVYKHQPLVVRDIELSTRDRHPVQIHQRQFCRDCDVGGRSEPYLHRPGNLCYGRDGE